MTPVAEQTAQRAQSLFINSSLKLVWRELLREGGDLSSSVGEGDSDDEERFVVINFGRNTGSLVGEGTLEAEVSVECV